MSGKDGQKRRRTREQAGKKSVMLELLRRLGQG